MSRGRETFAPTLDDLEAIARRAVAVLPREVRRRIGDLVLRIEDFPDDETVEEMDLESPYDLLGLYSGGGLASQAAGAAQGDIDMVFLYRGPILSYWCDSDESLEHIVRHVVVHEIGHHLGLSDDDMDRIERQVGQG